MKAYQFRFSAQTAVFGENGMVSVLYGLCADGLKNNLPGETRTCTFPEALAYLQTYSDATPGPHAAFLRMANDRDRCPPGFKAAKRRVYRETP